MVVRVRRPAANPPGWMLLVAWQERGAAHVKRGVCGPLCSFWGPDGTWNWEADAAQRWMLLAACDRGATLFEAFSNSPPYWMTVSGRASGAPSQLDTPRVCSFLCPLIPRVPDCSRCKATMFVAMCQQYKIHSCSFFCPSAPEQRWCDGGCLHDAYKGHYSRDEYVTWACACTGNFFPWLDNLQPVFYDHFVLYLTEVVRWYRDTHGITFRCGDA